MMSIGGIKFANSNSNSNSGFNGVWLSDVKSHIRIEKCGAGLCGYISKIAIRGELYQKNKEAIDKVGIQNAYDYFNKDPALRSRPLLGLKILNLDTRQSATKYSGTIYNPEDGKTYKGSVELLNNESLQLTGCIFYGKICKSEDWVRIR
jgi:uncharacterized protein (DUF2147 family)